MMDLLTIDKDNKVQPGIAESYETSTDGLTWTFHLRKDAKWSDGSALTANDFVYSWRRVADPATAAPYGETVLGMVEGYEDAIGNPDDSGNTTTTPDTSKLGVEATDDYTFVVHLAKPCTFFDKLAAFPTLSPVKESAVSADPDGWAVTPKEYLTDGAFYISDWVPGSYITFTKNPNYYNADAVKLDSIKCLLMSDSAAAYSAYQTGEAQMIKDVPTEEIASLSGTEDYHIDPDLGTYYISINDSLDQFKDSKVREALSLALDRDYIAKTITGGTYTAAGNFIGTGVSDWDGSNWMDNANGGKTYIDLTDPDGNMAKAKQLLADAGYPNGEGFPAITYSMNDAGYHKAIAEYVQAQWQALGLTVNVETVEWKSFLPQRRAGDYQISRNGWLFDYNDASNMLDLLYSTNGNNDGKYNNPDYDALMDKARAETDPATRSGYLHQAEDLIMSDTACIPLLYYNDFYLQSTKVTGSWHSPYGFWYFQFADVTE
jgi:oligopeptide transport system substrate-binding protein